MSFSECFGPIQADLSVPLEAPRAVAEPCSGADRGSRCSPSAAQRRSVGRTIRVGHADTDSEGLCRFSASCRPGDASRLAVRPTLFRLTAMAVLLLFAAPLAAEAPAARVWRVKTAKALRLTIPSSLLLRADEGIE